MLITDVSMINTTMKQNISNVLIIQQLPSSQLQTFGNTYLYSVFYFVFWKNTLCSQTKIHGGRGGGCDKNSSLENQELEGKLKARS